MSTVTCVLSAVDKREGTNAKGPWTKFTFKDGNAVEVGATFSAPLGDAAQSLLGQRVELDLEPAKDPKFAPTVKAIRPAPEEKAAQNGDDRMSKAEWRAKDMAADKRACIAIAAGSLTHTMKAEPTKEELEHFAARTIALARRFYEETRGTWKNALNAEGMVLPEDDATPF